MKLLIKLFHLIFTNWSKNVEIIFSKNDILKKKNVYSTSSQPLAPKKTQLPKNEIQFVIYANQAANNSLINHAENN